MAKDIYSIPSPWEQHLKGNSHHRFEIVNAQQVTLTTSVPQLVIEDPLPAGTLCGFVYVNRGRIRIGVVDPLPGSESQGLIFRKGESFFLSSEQTLAEVQIFKDGTTESAGYGDPDPMRDNPCSLAEVTILYLKASPVPG